ncbi:MAG: RagB/SusD family nutrient uptake outer membrane protein [Mariniphaga sp.]|nr:RagB/SusD family nutrient uptake outer membrane protein [Mariniphaga sp.]
MKVKVKYIILVLLLSTQFSCNDWIELLPPGGLIREEFWQTKEDVTAVLMGAYESFATLDGDLFQYGEMRGDMVQYDRNLGGTQRNIMDGNIYPTNGMSNWSNFYRVINYTNEIIKNAPLVQEIDDTYTDYQLRSIVSEAYFLRSLAYFYLVRIFKDVPLIVEPTESDDSEFYYPKSDGDEVCRALLVDLEANRQFAPSEYNTPQEHRGRATKAAYDALIADIALWLFDYEKCIQYVENIEANIEYVLVPSVQWFTMYYPGNSLEGIFEFQFDEATGQTNDTYGITNRLSYNYDPSQKALEMFAFDYGAAELYRGEDSGIKKYGEDDYIIWKYVGRAPDGRSTRSGTIQGGCNWIVYRLADVLLMKAEALSQLERYSEASNIINEIRERADVPPLVLPNSKNVFEDAILEERALELAFEGKRWFDLLRMGRRNNFARKSDLIEVIIQNVPSTQKRILATKLTNPMGWYMPILESELERNLALVQNPYYKF